MKVGDIVKYRIKILYGQRASTTIGKVTCINPIKVDNRFWDEIEDIHEFIPNIYDFYNLCEDACYFDIFMGLYKKYPFDLNIEVPTFENGKSRHHGVDSSFLMGPIGNKWTPKVVNFIHFILDNGAIPLPTTWTYIMKEIYGFFEEKRKIPSNMENTLIRMITHFGTDPFQEIDDLWVYSLREKVYPLWLYANRYPKFLGQLLSLKEIRGGDEITWLIDDKNKDKIRLKVLNVAYGLFHKPDLNYAQIEAILEYTFYKGVLKYKGTDRAVIAIGKRMAAYRST